jgi:hypothetical protein
VRMAVNRGAISAPPSAWAPTPPRTVCAVCDRRDHGIRPSSTPRRAGAAGRRHAGPRNRLRRLAVLAARLEPVIEVLPSAARRTTGYASACRDTADSTHSCGAAQPRRCRGYRHHSHPPLRAAPLTRRPRRGSRAGQPRIRRLALRPSRSPRASGVRAHGCRLGQLGDLLLPHRHRPLQSLADRSADDAHVGDH